MSASLFISALIRSFTIGWGYIQEILIRAIGTPKNVLSRVNTVNRKFNRNKEVEVVKLHRSGALVRLHWDKNLVSSMNKDFCLMNQGVYSALLTVWGLPPAKVTETKCQFEGSPYCEFDLSWMKFSLVRRLKMLIYNRRRLLMESLSEIERDKSLLEGTIGEIQNLNRRLQQKIDHLWSIHEASRAILSELDYGRLLPEVLRIFIREIGYSRGLIMLIDPKRDVLRFVEGVDEKARDISTLDDYEIPLTRTGNILVKVAKSGQPVIADDAALLKLNQQNLIIRNFRPQSIVLLPLLSRGKVIGVLAADRDPDKKSKPTLDRDYLQGFANQVALAIENARMYKELRESYLISIQALVEALEAKDPYTRGHSERVTNYSVLLAERIKLPQNQVEQIRKMSMVHDIGKIGIDRMILNKNGRLLEDEYELIKQHPIIGHKIIEPMNLSREEVSIVRHHHERYDGKGYPDNLAGESIPIMTRIVSICDTFDAMTSNRPYRTALGEVEALSRLSRAAGSQLDTFLVDEFLELVLSGAVNEILMTEPSAKVA